jgi:hypothetical protein
MKIYSFPAAPVQVDPQRGDCFYDAVRCYYPGLPDGALQPSYCGIRPKITGPGEPDADFVIQVIGSLVLLKVACFW